MLPYSAQNVVLVAAQAAIVALPAAGLPAWARRFAGVSWWLVIPGSIIVVVGLLAVLPELADGLTWLALLAIPPLAVAALGWAMRGARVAYGVVAVGAFVVALAYVDERAGELAALALSALSCVTLGRLLAGATPTTWLRIGLVAMAVIDAVLVFSEGIDKANTALIVAAPAPGLPQLQFAQFDGASMGYGDLFVAGVLGGVLSREGASARLQALACVVLLGVSLVFDLLFWAFDSLPATVPVAVVALIFGGLQGLRDARP
ncbi:MAG TPA: hypothetical protein VFZ89_15240 [Solirubrobacteraceae bacterium]